MAFHVDLNTRGITSYATALHKWKTTVPLRGTDDKNIRPLDKRKKKHMTIRVLNDESVALSLYGTDVVIYHPDDTITLTPYQSVSTDKFCRHFTPNGISSHFNDILGYMVQLRVGVGDDEKPYGHYHFFLFSGPMRLKRIDDQNDLWAVDERTTTQMPFKKYHVNRKKAKEASAKYNLRGFTDWFNAMLEMGGLKNHRKENFFWNDEGMAAILLSDQDDKWQEFLRHVWDYEAVRKFKDLIYRVEKVGYVEEAMTLKSWDEWRSISNAKSRNWRYV